MGDVRTADVQSGSPPSVVSTALLEALGNSINVLQDDSVDLKKGIIDTTLRKHGPEPADTSKLGSFASLPTSPKDLCLGYRSFANLDTITGPDKDVSEAASIELPLCDLFLTSSFRYT